MMDNFVFPNFIFIVSQLNHSRLHTIFSLVLVFYVRNAIILQCLTNRKRDLLYLNGTVIAISCNNNSNIKKMIF